MIAAPVIAALIWAETRYFESPADNGDAVGILQIRPCVVIDVNLMRHHHFTMEDRRDPLKSIEICRIYLDIWAGKDPLPQTCAVIWRFGPRGMRSSTYTWGKWVHYRANFEIGLGRLDLCPYEISSHEQNTQVPRGALRRFLHRLGSLCARRTDAEPESHFDRLARERFAKPDAEPHSYD